MPVRLRFLFIGVALVVSGFASSCSEQGVSTSPPNTSTPRPEPTVDRTSARQVSDAMVNDFLHDRRPELMARMESGFQEYYSAQSFSEVIDWMILTYGKPLDVEYKVDEPGRKTAIGYDKPIRKFWYATRTSMHPRGKVFITVEIVPDGNTLAGTSLNMVTFPLGEIPEHLK